MNAVFADSVYWIALINPDDQWHQKATAAREPRSDTEVMTTEDVLVEVLTYFGGYGPDVRRTAARAVRAILDNSGVNVIPHDTDTFMAGLELYEARLDKSYSMVDCMSMQVMREYDLEEVLTSDHHFMQEGFTILL
ncbi:putative nucleic acid-binding protein [Salinibacter ruber]|uniref:type II toxin-antitoxin system VapC family toxin n=1 Tax=Salinibacter ruber TaxID=146919 RepID=UPI0021685727|nr:PIN domain-containing protein [Salinibacter ruber]MCS4034689.1 putative nucleic acid-binding protein [Salinibacter ruber]